jgi:hypothetical protein
MKSPPTLGRWISAGVLTRVWLLVSLFLFVAMQIVSHKDAWHGWVDLWPLLVAYGAGTAGVAVGVVFLLRPRSDHKGVGT